MFFKLKNVVIASSAAVVVFVLWKWHESMFKPPTIEDYLLASTMKPISYMRRNKLTRYYDRVERNLEDLKREIPHLSLDLNKFLETASELRDWCNSNLRSYFYPNLKESRDKLKLVSKYCVMNVKDQILEEDDIRLLEKPEEYKSSFRRNKESIYHKPNVHSMELDDVNDEGGARMLESWCMNSFAKPYSFKNYRIFRYSQDWCAQRIK